MTLNSYAGSGKKVMYRLFILALSLLCSYIGRTQTMRFSPVEGREQLNEEQIRNIIQLKDGRIGVFTEGMLNLYDGSGFKTIHIDDENSIALPGYTGFHHSYLESNRIWFKNGRKLAIIDLVEERSEKEPEAVLKHLGITEKLSDLYIDNHEDIWLLTQGNTLLCRNKKNGTKTVFLKDVARKPAPHDPLYDVVRAGNSIYLLYKSGTLRCFDRKTRREIFSKAIGPGNTKDFSEWSHITVVGNILYIVRVGNLKGQLVRFNTTTRKAEVLIQANDYWLNCFAVNKKGDIYMSCKRGLWQIPAETGKAKLIRDIDIVGGTKIHNEISTILFDSQGGFWLGTLNRGLYYYHPDRFRFHSFQKSDVRMDENTEFAINCFSQAADNRLLVGTGSALYEVPLPLTKEAQPSVLLGKGCNSLYKDYNGKIWVGATDGLYTVEGKQAKKVLDIPINYIAPAGGKRMYLCTATQGVLEYDFTVTPVNKPISSPENVKQAVTWNGTLIGISSRGPFVTDLKKNTFSLPLEQGRDRPEMFRHVSHRYTCLMPDTQGDLWMGTYDGLTVWSTKEQKLYELNTETGLINNSIKGIVEDADHSFWITTSRGISHVFKKHGDGGYIFDVQNFNNLTGVLEHAFSERSVFIGADATFFAGGIDGFNYITRDDKSGLPALNPVLTGLQISGNSRKSYPATHINIAQKSHLELDYYQNFFRITFSGLNYSNPAQTYYRYRLDGVDKGWRYYGPESGIGEANYTNVAPSEYAFVVQASADGIDWPGGARILILTISPPFWKTAYAYCLYIITVVALSLFVIVRVTAANRARRSKQQERAIEEAKTDFITNISHELRTPLTLIITPLRALMNTVTEGTTKKKLQQINSSAQMMLETVGQLLEFKKIDSGSEALHLHFYESLQFIEELCDGYMQLANEKGIRLQADISDTVEGIYIDRQKVTRIVGNLLSNALKFTPGGGAIYVNVDYEPVAELLKITVRDTGSGISEKELGNIFNRFYQADNQHGQSPGSGIGLYMVKQYAQMHRGNVTVESTPGVGTRFEVILSVSREEPDDLSTMHHTTDSKTLLIAEDNKALQEYLVGELKTNFNIIVVGNGVEALHNAIKYTPDLIICDMMMPEMGGPEFCTALRKNIAVSHIPVIMLTGRTSDEARLEAYGSGADAFLVKPFDIALLNVRISKLLELRDSRRRAFVEEKEISTEEVTNNPLDKELLDQALKLVHDNISQPGYSVEKFSADMNMDRTGLYRKLTALTGLSPIAFIREIRLRKAAELLTTTQTPVSDIAHEVGFSSVSYFTKCFHEAFAKTPSQYRTDTAIQNRN